MSSNITGTFCISHRHQKLSILLFLLLIMLCGCSQKWDSSQLKSGINSDIITSYINITSETVEYPTDVDKIDVLITNNDRVLSFNFGEDSYLEVFLDGEWYVVPILEGVFWHDIAIELLPEQNFDYTIDIAATYGELPPGNYRYVKSFWSNFDDIMAAFEFTIK